MLTIEEQAVIKGDILGWTDSQLVQWRTDGDPYSILNWYNQIAVPEWIIWKNRISREDIAAATVYSGAGGLISRSQGERDVFAFIYSLNQINPSNSNVRQAFADIFSGTGQAAVDTRNALLAVSKRPSTNLEKLFSTGTGTVASPATTTMDRYLDPERDIRQLLT